MSASLANEDPKKALAVTSFLQVYQTVKELQKYRKTEVGHVTLSSWPPHLLPDLLTQCSVVEEPGKNLNWKCEDV